MNSVCMTIGVMRYRNVAMNIVQSSVTPERKGRRFGAGTSTKQSIVPKGAVNTRCETQRNTYV